VQLIGKTNQFNLTTRRHGEREVLGFGSRPGAFALALRVRDRFGDAGVVGVALCEQVADACRIDTFLLSCRVIGRGVETALLAAIAGRARASGALRLIGEYVPSARNPVCANFYPSHGFRRTELTGEDHAVRFDLDLREGGPQVPGWIQMTGASAQAAGEGAPV
jgi:FkbH-like protein